MKSPIVFPPQVGSQRPNSSKLMTIPSGKPQTAIYSNNSRFPSPGLFSTKVVAHDPSISAFTVPASRSSAFNRVSAIQNPTNSRRNMVFKEEHGGTRMVWQGASSNEQVYRMAQITSQQPANGSNSIIQIPQSLQNHPGIYIDQSSLASQFYPYQNSGQNSSVPIVINPRDINSNVGYLTTPLNQAHRPPILRKLSKQSERPHSEDHKDNGQAPPYSHGDPSVYSLKERGANAKLVKMKPPSRDPYLFADSPRKKPRKQAVVAHEDVFASNVPQSARMENIGTSASYVTQPATANQEQVDEEYMMSFYPPRKRMTLLPPSSKCPTRLFNHFERHSDIKVRKKKNICEPIPSISEIASQGWQLLHLKAQLEDISSVQRDTKTKLCEYKDYFCNISLEIEDKGSGARAGNDSISDLLQNISHCCQSNVTQLKQTMTAIDKLLNTHKPKILELAKEFKEKTNVKTKKVPPQEHRSYKQDHSTPTQSKKTETAPASGSSKRTRKRKT
ncbi:hypothetical protein ACHWQZ_G010679 [Mnemiopsis leidyi]